MSVGTGAIRFHEDMTYRHVATRLACFEQIYSPTSIDHYAEYLMSNHSVTAVRIHGIRGDGALFEGANA